MSGAANTPSENLQVDQHGQHWLFAWGRNGTSIASKGMRLLGGASAGQILIVLASPILTRYLQPKAFGMYGIYSSLLLLLVVIAPGRLDHAIPVPQSDRRAKTLLRWALRIANSFGFCLFIIGLLAADPLLNLLSHHFPTADPAKLQFVLLLVPLGLMATASFNAMNYWAVRMDKYQVVIRARVWQALSMLLLQITLAYKGIGAAGLMLGHACGQLVGVGLFVHAFFRIPQLQRRWNRPGRWRYDRYVLVRYRHLPLVVTWAQICNRLCLHSPILLISWLYGLHVAGLLLLVQRACGTPMMIVARSLGPLYLGKLAHRARTGSGGVLASFLRCAGCLAVIALPPTVVILVFGPQLFEFIFSHEWGRAGELARILAIAFFCQFVTSPLSQTFALLDRQSWQLFCDATRLLLVLLAFLIAGNFGLEETAAIQVYSLCLSLGFIITFLIAAFCLHTRKPADAAGSRLVNGSDGES